MFKDTNIDRVDSNYGAPALSSYRFKNAKLQVVENQGDVYIVGNLQLYNIKERENEKPMYLILQSPQVQTIDPTQALVSKLVVYPNPIPADHFKLSFELAAQTPIAIKIYDLMGLLKHQQNLITSGTGQQEQSINFNAPKGNYILNLYYNDQVLRTILIKQ